MFVLRGLSVYGNIVERVGGWGQEELLVMRGVFTLCCIYMIPICFLVGWTPIVPLGFIIIASCFADYGYPK